MKTSRGLDGSACLTPVKTESNFIYGRLSPELKFSIGFKARDGKEVMSEVKKLLQ